jgi:hypothetical protein
MSQLSLSGKLLHDRMARPRMWVLSARTQREKRGEMVERTTAPVCSLRAVEDVLFFEFFYYNFDQVLDDVHH